jgi:hypothetical protein
MSATFDTTTKAAYDAATTAQSRAEAIVASLTGTISVKVFNGSNTEMGSGTMAAPWATAVAGAVVLGEVSSFTVGTTGTPDANWYIRFQNADVSRWARGSFGLSGADYNWSLATWESGQTGTIGTATIVAAGNEAPVFSVAPTVASLGPTGGTVQFTATDPEGGEVFYSLTTTRAGITINASSGLVTVTAAAAGTSGNIVVRASDGILTTSATCAVTVASTSQSKKWHPGHYVKTQGDHSQTDQAAYIAAVQNTFPRSLDNSTLKGNEAALAWGAINPTGSTFTGSAIDNWLAWHEINGRRLILEISYKNFRPNVGVLAPADLIASGNVIQTLTGWVSAVWRPAVMDRFIAAMQWLAQNYDDESLLELVLTTESAPSLSTAQAPDYSQAALHTQLQRLIAACGTAFTRTTTIVPQINNLGTYPPQLIEGAYQAGGGFGSPDCRPTSESILIFGGETVDGIGTGLRDYRGQMAHFEIASASALNEFTGDMAGLIDFAQQYAVTHLSWVTSSSTPGQTWAEIKSAIASDPDLYTACPIIYSDGCDVT